MNRREFTYNISLLIFDMVVAGEQPIYDYCMRSPEEQGRLYAVGKSGCDGVSRISLHQRGRALDIYLWNNEKQAVDFVWNPVKSAKWHERWVTYGGKPLVTYHDRAGNLVNDYPHFEG